MAALPDKRASDNLEAVIVGWGSLRTFNKYTGDPLLSDTLQKLKVLIITNEKCQQIYKNEYVIIHNQMCTLSKCDTGVSWVNIILSNQINYYGCIQIILEKCLLNSQNKKFDSKYLLNKHFCNIYR